MQNSSELLRQNNFNHTRVFLVLFCLLLAIQLLWGFSRQLRYFKTQPGRLYGPAPAVLGLIKLPRVTPVQFALLGTMLVVSMLAAALNLLPRLCLLIGLVCYFAYFNQIMSLDYVQRKTNLIPAVLFVLLLAPAIDQPFAQTTTPWPLLLVKLAIAQMYLSSGIQKLRRSGLRWANGRSLQAYLVQNYLWSDSERALKLARRPRACMALSSLMLLFELTFWIIVLYPQLTMFYVAAALLFHLGTALIMRINYLKYLSPVYMVFVPDLAHRLANALA